MDDALKEIVIQNPIASYAAMVATIGMIISIISLFISLYNSLKSRPIMSVHIHSPGVTSYYGQSFDTITFFIYNVGGSAFSVINYEVRVYEGFFFDLFRVNARIIKGNGRMLNIEPGKSPTSVIEPKNCPPVRHKGRCP